MSNPAVAAPGTRTNRISQPRCARAQGRRGELVFKLEARQLSLWVARLGAQIFTMDTGGAQGLRVYVHMHGGGNRVQLSQIEPGEEY